MIERTDDVQPEGMGRLLALHDALIGALNDRHVVKGQKDPQTMTDAKDNHNAG